VNWEQLYCFSTLVSRFAKRRVRYICTRTSLKTEKMQNTTYVEIQKKSPAQSAQKEERGGARSSPPCGNSLSVNSHSIVPWRSAAPFPLSSPPPPAHLTKRAVFFPGTTTPRFRNPLLLYRYYIRFNPFLACCLVRAVRDEMIPAVSFFFTLSCDTRAESQFGGL
jgi:hypothetical protein